MKTVALVAAVAEANRLPNMVMELINGTPLIGIVLARLERLGWIDEIIVTTPEGRCDDSLAEYVDSLGNSVFPGSESDILDSYAQAATSANVTHVLRIRGDRLFINSTLVDEVSQEFNKAKVQYGSSMKPRTYPKGLDTEVFTCSALKRD